jgi:hypothetical protein
LNSVPDPAHPNPDAQNAVQGPLYKLLQDLIYPDLPLEAPDDLAESLPDPQLDWDAMGDGFEGWLAPSHMQASNSSQRLAQEW